MCERVRVFVLEVVLQVMDVHVTCGERLSGCDVEVADNLVDSDAALETAALLSLCIKMFGIVFALALLDVLSTAKGPRY
jgi:hypothetical protein